MILEKGKNNRLLIYTYYDKDGIVDRYVPYLLRGFEGCVSEILVAVNGTLNDEERTELESVSSSILMRENNGFDIWGYKAGLYYYGWDGLERFDEVIMMNSTVMGPLHPFSEMFDEMDSRDVDFWGITLYHGSDFDPYGKIECGYIPEHLQSYFIAVRRHMLLSPEHRDYWDNLPEINSYEDAIALHEAIFTKKFEDYGFLSSVYIDTESKAGFSDNAAIFDPLWLIRDMKCPVIKRRCFFTDYHYYMAVCTGEVAAQALEYIRDNLDYDTDMIWETILRTKNQLDISRALALNFVLPEERLIPADAHSGSSGGSAGGKKAALIFHAYYDDLFDTLAPYISAMPEGSDIIFTTDTPQKQEKLISLYKDSGNPNVRVILAENRGRSESALLVAARDLIYDYDYVCFAHDKKNPSSIKYGLTGQSFAFKCYNNILASRSFTENVLAAFENNPRLGMLAPPPPIHAEYYHVVMHGDWGINCNGVKELAGRLGLNVDIAENKGPLAPLGGMLWFRTAAMKKLFDYHWEYTDFPEEPVPVDGTILHAIERIYPLVVQDAGYYPARLYSDSFAEIELTNLNYYLCELTRAASELCGMGGTHQNLVRSVLEYVPHHKELLAELDTWKAHFKFQCEQNDLLSKQIENLETQLESAKEYIAVIEAKEAALLDSTSWKVTAPLRAVMGFLKK